MPLEKEKVLKILRELQKILPNGDIGITEIAECTDINRDTVYRYIGIMEGQGLVKINRIIQRTPLYIITKKGLEYIKENIEKNNTS